MLQLTGNSGCLLTRANINGTDVVIKSGNDRLEQDYNVLHGFHRHGFRIPHYYSVTPTVVVMEYLRGETMYEYLNSNKKIAPLIEFMYSVVHTSMQNSVSTDLEDALNNKYDSMLSALSPRVTAKLDFGLKALFDRLPTTVPAGMYHGDLTLENIVYANDQFYLIDANSSTLNSPIYDAVKIRQDTEFMWFARNYPLDAGSVQKLYDINDNVKQFTQYSSNDELLIFMLLRVLPYCKNLNDETLIIRAINKLWT